VLNQDQSPSDQLGVLTTEMPLLHKLARQRHDQTGNERIVSGAADLRGVTGASWPTTADHRFKLCGEMSATKRLPSLDAPRTLALERGPANSGTWFALLCA
jgi:hypothetical protein